ncbi:LysM peptidoglycan-binding domain-containing protein [Pseudobacillus sp. FSL P4-0506]|uniref:LysM peptidoglycan-binding domain-containing protein n=1 Tax=Pseudobacillus sp. FSL P4-0506 TaxID=2921576 RepID=UPI0030F91167
MRKPIYVSAWEIGNSSSNVVFPVPPESFPTEVGGKAEVIEILGAGERTVFGGSKLDRFTLESFFPDHYDPSYVVNAPGTYKIPSLSIGKLREWCDKEVPLQLYSKAGGLNRSVVITQLNYDNERAGHIGDVWFTVEFVNYKPPTFRKVAIKKSNGKTPAKPAPSTSKKPQPKLPAVHTVKKGETLSGIAKVYYGTADYVTVYNANKKLIDAANKKAKIKAKYNIFPGQKLTIPAKKTVGTGVTATPKEVGTGMIKVSSKN